MKFTAKYYIAAALIVAVASCTALWQMPRTPYITTDFYDACEWLKENTAVPTISGEDCYGKRLNFIPTYTVLSWWEYGNFIINIGHRVPESTPNSQFSGLQDYFAARTEQDAAAVISGSKVKYIVVTKQMVNDVVIMGFPPSGLIVDENKKEITLYTTQVYRLWYGQTELPLVYQNDTVKIYEVGG